MPPPSEIDRLAQRILALAGRGPIFYYDILRELRDEDYRAIMLAFGQIRQQRLFGRDDKGRYVLAETGREEGARA